MLSLFQTVGRGMVESLGVEWDMSWVESTSLHRYVGDEAVSRTPTTPQEIYSLSYPIERGM